MDTLSAYETPKVFFTTININPPPAMEDQIKHYADKLAYEIDPADLKIALANKENIVVIDARSTKSYETEHIPGAIILPHRTMNKDTTRTIDQSALVVTYCDGIGCNASTRGALNMAQLGFRVKELIGGIDWWKRDGYPTAGTKGSGGEPIACGCN